MKPIDTYSFYQSNYMLTFSFFIFSKLYQEKYPHHKEYLLEEQYNFIQKDFISFTKSEYDLHNIEKSIRLYINNL